MNRPDKRRHDKACGTTEDQAPPSKPYDAITFLEEVVPKGLTVLNTEVWEWLSVGHIRNWGSPFGFLGSFHSLILWLTLASQVRVKIEVHYEAAVNEPAAIPVPLAQDVV